MKNLKGRSAQELLDLVKGSKGDLRIVFMKNGRLLKNEATGNLMEVYHYNYEDGESYGVYSDLISKYNYQIDSKTNTDEEMLKLIDLLLAEGIPEILEEA